MTELTGAPELTGPADLPSLISQALSHPYDEAEQAAVIRLADQLTLHAGRIHRRDCPGGHVTASVMLVDVETTKTFLVLHPRFGRWMQLGGHVEDGESVAGAALREVHEESGLNVTGTSQLLGFGAFDDVPCPAGESSAHFDVRFLSAVRAGRYARAAHTDEHLDSGWFDLTDLPTPHDADLALLATQALGVLHPTR